MPKILIIDDDDDLSLWLQTVLGAAGYAVETMVSAEGVERYLKLGHVDLVLLDYHLPGQSGLSLLRELRLIGHTIPIVMLTADGSQQVAVECFRAGASDFIAKPVDADYLKIIVARTLDHHAKSLKDHCLRVIGYTQHRPGCVFHTNGKHCDCGLKDILDGMGGF